MVITLAIAFSVMQTPSFTSSTLILSDVNTASESVLGSFFSAAMFDPDRFIKTQAEIIQTEVVAQGVEARLTENYAQIKERQALGSDQDVYVPEYVPGASELMTMVMVKQRERTNTFEIDVTTSNQYLARDVAQAYAEEYINNRQLAAIRQISEARKEVWNRIQELEDQIEQVSQRIDQYTNGNVPSELQAEGSRAINLWTTLYEKYMSLRIAESLQQRGLEIIENAKLGGQVGPRPYRNAILGMLVGLLLGIGLAFLWEYLDDTLKTREDFEKYYDCPIVGEIAFTPTEEAGEFEIVYFSRPNLPAVEGYRSLRTNIQFLKMEKGIKTILVTSASPEEGKSTVLVNLAAALSEMGKKVIIVEADLRRPALHKYLSCAELNGSAGPGTEKGLTAVLAGSASLEDSLCDTSLSRAAGALLRHQTPQPIRAGLLPPHGEPPERSGGPGGLCAGGRPAHPGHQRRGGHLPHGGRSAAGGQLRHGRTRHLPPLRQPAAQGEGGYPGTGHQQRHSLGALRLLPLLLLPAGRRTSRGR